MTARELAERLEVSERTIHRDMEALSGSGVPVTAERGAAGGWMLPDSYQTNLTGLNLPEIQALFLPGPSRILADLGLQDAAQGALLKLLATLPDARRQEAEFVRQRIHIDGVGWNPSEERVTILPVLQEAIWQERKLQMTYQRSDGTGAPRLVDPLGLVAKGSAWYLIAAVEGEVRTYRVSRIQSVRLADEPCARPAGFDLAAFWAQSAADFVANLPRYPAVVRVAPHIIPRMRFAGRFARIEQTDLPGADGWSRVAIRFETEDEAREYVLAYGPDIEVLEPAELREKVIDYACRTVAFYAQKGEGVDNRGESC